VYEQIPINHDISPISVLDITIAGSRMIVTKERKFFGLTFVPSNLGLA
jgi:hypothetical protein